MGRHRDTHAFDAVARVHRGGIHTDDPVVRRLIVSVRARPSPGGVRVVWLAAHPFHDEAAFERLSDPERQLLRAQVRALDEALSSYDQTREELRATMRADGPIIPLPVLLGGARHLR